MNESHLHSTQMRIQTGQEFVIGGYTLGGTTFDALVFGYYEGDQDILSTEEKPASGEVMVSFPKSDAWQSRRFRLRRGDLALSRQIDGR
jgi:hypothetical protein